MKKYALPRLKLGGTSFLLHAGYVSGFRFAAERCDDVALLLMETGDRGEFLPTHAEIGEIGAIADGEGASLHVHLPTDEDFGTAEGTRVMVDAVRTVVDRTAPLHPHSFVLHVDFPLLQGKLLATNADGEPPEADRDGGKAGLTDEQRHWTAEALREIAACLPSPRHLAVENLETFPTNFWDVWLDGAPYSRCIDIGHIWKDGGDPAPVLAQWLPRARVVHLHGLEPRASAASAPGGFPGGGRGPSQRMSSRLFRLFGPRPRDHTSLRLMPPGCIDAVIHPLWDAGFAGVLVLEVFTFDDFTASHDLLLQSWERYSRA